MLDQLDVLELVRGQAAAKRLQFIGRIHGDAADGLLVGARIVNREVEKLVRERPEQYLWGYNRYKRPAGAPPPPAAVQ